ncbi:dTDP-4-amino-4,6-dideoxygalactose transaminase [Adhaeribacter radiodurans]|uniref:dTDP-4-amino-4,6-dideoxygalactose transaminase n=1 Tax=Adhaeribacter radiodurans TaxID=2745197 RepID=A0A7L7LEY2_9BACT|nr:dTDP-4-amino-4,6-dideoxygalactose transaminase [Adhaeribacter radiodurans]
MVPFNKPFLTGKETEYIQQAVASGKISGNGMFTQQCQKFFEKRYGFKKTLLTSSGTDALEMAALLLNIQPGDEVIVPAYTFVSTANAFVLRGAKIVFADSSPQHPNLDVTKLESLITPRTKVIVPVHYAGIACDMQQIMSIAKKHNLFVVEDAAHALDSFYKEPNGLEKPLGSLGHLAAFSFHETKNIIAGEGGMLVINDSQFIQRAEIIWEKGTNRAAFFRDEIDKYEWVDVGSSFLPSEIMAAFLWAQLENLEVIQTRRKAIWTTYHDSLKELGQQNKLQLPVIPASATNNGFGYYVLCQNLAQRTDIIHYLEQKGVLAVFHYLALHKSPFYHQKHDGRELSCADRYTDTLLRLPFYYDLRDEEIQFICFQIKQFLA